MRVLNGFFYSLVRRTAMFLREHLERSLEEVGAESASAIFDELKKAYTESGRFYHTDKHVAECLTHFQRLRALATRPSEIEVALWFHDAVYDTRKSDNEERSAEWAKSFLKSAGCSADSIARIERLILSTKTHEPHDSDAEIMLDVDLGILGTPPYVFENYDAAIRREYHWVPEAQFREGRAQVLSGFLERPEIYRTSLFLNQYEYQARQNLTKKIEELRLT